MIRYTSSDLQIVTAGDYIHAHIAQFFPGGVVTGARLACGIVEDALLMGVQKVLTVHQNDCWAVIGSEDWLNADTVEAIDQMFSRMTSFPEGGINSMRSEVLLPPFCSDILAATPESDHAVKGTAGHLRQLLTAPFQWSRAIAFCVRRSAEQKSG